MPNVRRRKFITLLGGAVWPLAARGQQSERRLIGVLTTLAESDASDRQASPSFGTNFRNLGGQAIAISGSTFDGLGVTRCCCRGSPKNLSRFSLTSFSGGTRPPRRHCCEIASKRLALFRDLARMRPMGASKRAGFNCVRPTSY
jgi:hypothetical protein